MFIILAHELTPHANLFVNEFDDEREDDIWFEEGMCFYLPRKILLNEMEFNEITNAEIELVGVFKLKNTEKRYLASQTISNKNEEESMTVMISYN